MHWHSTMERYFAHPVIWVEVAVPFPANEQIDQEIEAELLA
jgi:hypothetical protein